jgi:hypothetical protein
LTEDYSISWNEEYRKSSASSSMNAPISAFGIPFQPTNVKQCGTPDLRVSKIVIFSPQQILPILMFW